MAVGFCERRRRTEPVFPLLLRVQTGVGGDGGEGGEGLGENRGDSRLHGALYRSGPG